LDLLVIGVHEHLPAASAAVIDCMSASDKDWRRIQCVTIAWQLNNGEIHAFSETHF
jgi:hypothetical protein